MTGFADYLERLRHAAVLRFLHGVPGAKSPPIDGDEEWIDAALQEKALDDAPEEKRDTTP